MAHPSLLSSLSLVSTSNQWSVLESLLPKLNKKLDRVKSAPATLQELTELLVCTDDDVLLLHGIWKHGFGNSMIVCTNPAFARACAVNGLVLNKVCSCGVGEGHRDMDHKRYFQSHDYNGGRHASTQSKHIANCSMWRPAPTSHLHSWRRGFGDKKNKGIKKRMMYLRKEKS